MSVLRLIDEIERQLPGGSAFGTRWRTSARVVAGSAVHEVTIAARIDRQGRRREQFFCDGLRVDKAVLLRLTCPETECPHALGVRAQWNRRGSSGTAAPPAPPAVPFGVLRPVPPPPPALIEEHPVVIGAHRCTARPARFPCFTPCPHRAHPSLMIDKSGFDLFEDGAYVGGGVTLLDGTARPRLPTLQAAEAFVLARHLEAMATLSALGLDKRRPHR